MTGLTISGEYKGIGNPQDENVWFYPRKVANISRQYGSEVLEKYLHTWLCGQATSISSFIETLEEGASLNVAIHVYL
jgi:hypothetical protein